MPGTIGCLFFERPQDSHQQLSAQRMAHRCLAGQTLVNWVLRRASEAQQLHGLVVSLSPEWDTPALRAAVPGNVRWHVARYSDSLARMRGLASWYGAETGQSVDGLVQLRIDCPLLDPCLLDRLITSAQDLNETDYVTYRSSHGGSSLHAQLGFFAEYIRVSALDRMHQLRPSAEDRLSPGAFLLSHPELFQLRLLALPAPLDRDDLRLSMKHAEDWEHAEQIVEALGHDRLDWQRIVALLEQQPVVRERMATLNRHEARVPASHV